MGKRIVILGGGFAGLYSARALRDRFGDRAEIEVITAENYFVFQPLLPEVAAGSVTPINAVAPMRYLLPGIKVRKAVVDDVDFEAREVTIFQGVQRRPTIVGYDHVVVALGQGSDLSSTPGLTAHALTMKTLEDARRLRAHVLERLEHADITGLPEVKRGALTFVVVGGGFSGIETVGEMKELIDRSLRFYPNIRPSEVTVIVLEFADRILGEMPEKLRDYAMRNLKSRGIDVRLGVGVKSVTGTQLVTTEDDVIETRTVVATIGNAPLPVVTRMGLPLTHGRVKVDRSFRVEGHETVWSLGDCAMIPMKDDASERGDFAPPTAQFAVREARALAEAIGAVEAGRSPAAFEYTSKGALASLGGRRGVADVMGVRLTGFVAWLLWRAYYVAFLPGIATRIRVLVSWILDAITPRPVVVIRSSQPKPSRQVHFRAGDRIYETGTRADGLYTVIEGTVEVIGEDPETGEERRRDIGPGGHFGERMLLGATRRVATARAKTDVVALVMSREEFLRIAEGLPPFRDHFKAHLEKEGLDWDAPRGASIHAVPGLRTADDRDAARNAERPAG